MLKGIMRLFVKEKPTKSALSKTLIPCYQAYLVLEEIKKKKELDASHSNQSTDTTR